MLLVVKVGGSILQNEPLPDLASDLKRVHPKHKVILVHGGGKMVTEIAAKLGKTQRFVVSPTGFRSRYTDKETMAIFTMVMAGKVNKQIVTALQSHGVPSVGISGLDGHLVRAKRKEKLVIVDERGRKRAVDGGFTGKIYEVNTHLLQLLIENQYVPVVAPIATGEKFEPLNIDGDRAAAYISGALGADKLLLLTDVEGLNLNREVIAHLKLSEIEEILPKIGRGMITKVYAAREALKQGVKEVIISSGLAPSPISSPLRHECGTVISNE